MRSQRYAGTRVAPVCLGSKLEIIKLLSVALQQNVRCIQNSWWLPADIRTRRNNAIIKSVEVHGIIVSMRCKFSNEYRIDRRRTLGTYRFIVIVQINTRCYVLFSKTSKTFNSYIWVCVCVGNKGQKCLMIKFLVNLFSFRALVVL